MTDTDETRELPAVDDTGAARVPRPEAAAAASAVRKAPEAPDSAKTAAPERPGRRAAAPLRAGSHRRRAARGRPARRVRPLLALAALLAAVAVAASVPQLRTVLRQSFTHLPQTTTALYFTTDPSIEGTVLSVPISVDGKNTGTDTYRVKVWTETAAGRVDGSTTAQVSTVKGVTASVVTLPIAADAAAVWASLDGTDQVIHFKIS